MGCAPSPRRRTLRRIAAALVIATALGLLAVRFAIVEVFHAPAGDGSQYFALSQQLITTGRYAFGPPPAPLTWVRNPG
jgi:hypothetical protein